VLCRSQVRHQKRVAVVTQVNAKYGPAVSTVELILRLRRLLKCLIVIDAENPPGRSELRTVHRSPAEKYRARVCPATMNAENPL